MPIIFESNIDSSVSYAVWQINETEEFFIDHLTLPAEDKNRILQLENKKRRLEKWACRLALTHLLKNQRFSISYSQNGQPLIENYHLSFSHSYEYAAVAIADHSVGIDIEKISPRLVNIHSRFMNSEEIAAEPSITESTATFYWCCKEALYKLHSRGEMDFKKSFHILSQNQGIIIQSNRTQPIDLQHHIINNMMLVIAYTFPHSIL